MPDSLNDDRNASTDVLSILSPAEVAALGGLPRDAIVGVFRDEAGTLDRFLANPEFLDYLHEFIRTAGPNDLELRQAAALQVSGWVYLIDLRTPEGPTGNVPPEDIIGAFEVAEGKLVEASYWANEDYQAFTRAGPIQLPPGLRREFFSVLKRTYPSGVSQ